VSRRKISQTELARQVFVRLSHVEAIYRAYQFIQIENDFSPIIFVDTPRHEFAKAYMGCVVLSMLYSLFDPSGVDLRNLRPDDRDFREALRELGRKWAPLCNPISRVRSNLTFHAADTIKRATDAEKAIRELGNNGLQEAFELIREIFALAPELRAEAGLSFRMPKSLRPEVEQLRHNCAAIDSLCLKIAARNLSGDAVEPMVTEAKKLCEETTLTYQRIAAALEQAVPPEERQFTPHFTAEWERAVGDRARAISSIEQSAATVRAMKTPGSMASSEHMRVHLEAIKRSLEQLQSATRR
jgi:hypothetical protein